MVFQQAVDVEECGAVEKPLKLIRLTRGKDHPPLPLLGGLPSNAKNFPMQKNPSISYYFLPPPPTIIAN